MSALSNSLVVPNQSSYGSSLKSLDQSSKRLSAQSRVGNAQLRTSKRTLSIQARYSPPRTKPPIKALPWLDLSSSLEIIITIINIDYDIRESEK
uniref:Uncharacterized protein n=1 Tax=Tanacetum cinerariifolium TaxID=118510 RepID=A0A6L2JTF1_TANCI|nr:hypothetical protein CTI12_AA059870 [Tanacetum cinerariifolium]